MARKKIREATDQRPFVMVYQDFLESDVLQNHYQKLVYIYLKKFANSKNQCYPSIRKLSKLTKIGMTKIKKTLDELEELGVIAKENRTREDGGKTSNLYTIYDYADIWKAESSTEIEEIKASKLVDLSKVDTDVLLAEIKRRKEKELDITESTKTTVKSSTQLNQYDMVNNTINTKNCQEERYTIDQVKKKYDYDIMINDYPYYKDEIDEIMYILYDNLNCKKKTIVIGGEEKQTDSIIEELEKLTYPRIIYCLNNYQKLTTKVKNPKQYILKMLLQSSREMKLGIRNQVNSDM